MKHQNVISGTLLNLWVMLLATPLWILVCGPFVFHSGWTPYWHSVYQILNLKLFAILTSGILVHEFLHAITWILLNQKGFKSVQFGFNIQAFTPYTHFKEPMKVWKYALGGAMPGIVMGIIPVLWSYIINSPNLNFVGFLFLWAAGGDFLSLWKLRKFNRNELVTDHPDKMGFFINDTE